MVCASHPHRPVRQSLPPAAPTVMKVVAHMAQAAMAAFGANLIAGIDDGIHRMGRQCRAKLAGIHEIIYAPTHSADERNALGWRAPWLVRGWCVSA